MDGWMDGWMDEWMDGTLTSLNLQLSGNMINGCPDLVKPPE